jgi:hypothetical protein
MFVAVEQVAGAHLTDRHGGQGSTGQLQWMRFNVPLTTDTELSPDEQALLLDAQTDDVSFGWVLIDIGLRENPPSSPDGLPGPQEIGSAFEALERLHSRGLIEVGRIEYRDGGSLGRVPPSATGRHRQASRLPYIEERTRGLNGPSRVNALRGAGVVESA